MEEMDTNLSEDELHAKKEEEMETNKCGENIEDENRMIEDIGENDSDAENSDIDDKINKEDEEDDDDDDDDDNEDDANEIEVKNLEETLLKNPYDYASHVALINLLSKMGELERLRVARENMSKTYPLSPELWRSWMQDEIKLAITNEEKIAVVELCERAVNDYLSVEIWLEYLQFSIGNMGNEKDAAENVRQLFQRALTAVSGHITKGAIIWEAFREFENVLVSMIDASNTTERIKQLDRVGKLFSRQLQVPLLDMEKTLNEYELWRLGDGATSTIDYQNVMNNYEIALKKLSDRLPFEEKLISSQNESELLDAFNAYLMYEKRQPDPGRVIVLFERAISELTIEASLWLDYVLFLESTIKIEDVLDRIFKRAARNVPWCCEIWRRRIRAYEKWGKTVTEVQTIFEEALQAGFTTSEEYKSLWLLYLEYLRRRIDDMNNDEEKDRQLETLRKTFNKACEYLANFGLEGDINCEILQFWARTEAIHAKDMEKARELWADILTQGHSSKAASWLEFISLEKCYGTTKHLRKLYPKALAIVKDWPESIGNAWINFERDEGTLEQLEIAEQKVKEKLEKIHDDRLKLQTTSADVNLFIKGKRKAEETGKMRKRIGISPQKISRLSIKDDKDNKLRENLLKSDGKRKLEKEINKLEPPPGYQEEKMEEDIVPEVDYKISIFISNLDFTATEDDLKDAISSAGEITLLKLVRDLKGRSKGFAYVQLSSSEAVDEALKLDRIKVKGRPMFISRCNPDKNSRAHAFKYKCSLEKNKLYIKGLPAIITKEELEELFKSHGTVVDIRIPVYRNGHAKGIAYVDFENENEASKALLATDGIEIKGKMISVAISNPKERKKESSEEEHLTKSLGAHPSGKSFSHPKPALAMIPRNVQLTSVNGNKSKSNETTTPLTNKDFREMLLKK
ncbi:squamous cell carcinoma antigen recognized by T-cells 3-like [Leptopilina boulardi]|uniref:squamous cell carcinoma antigen recognized by T-cells 3-like n=1 Tax=Leptopilina boulardi TaxID=63433 RepID=UPI0021F5FB38|nr:squamous cell carcinoma antigen recognized by T-cells 3-like [Leptopilina boulardi]